MHDETQGLRQEAPGNGASSQIDSKHHVPINRRVEGISARSHRLGSRIPSDDHRDSLGA